MAGSRRPGGLTPGGPAPSRPLVATGTGVAVTIHVQPGAARTELAGRHGDAIKLRVAAPPVDGAANEAVVRFLADRLGVRRRAVRIVTGLAARRKRLEIDGIALADAELALGPESA